MNEEKNAAGRAGASGASERPIRFPVSSVSDIPAELVARGQWVCWRYERGRGQKWTKPPYQTDGKTKADKTNPAHWSSFEAACAAAADPLKDLDGIGFVFTETDSYCGIDLDDCLDDKGVPLPWAVPIIKRFNTYTEISPSGKGVKMWLRGSLRELTGNKSGTREGPIETYDQRAYFTMTGLPLPGTPATIEERQVELTAWFRETFPKGPLPLPVPNHIPRLPAISADEEIVRMAMDAKNGAKFRALWEGKTEAYSSSSEADLALCSIVAFYVGPDPERIERIMRQSGLRRAKWDDHTSYLPATIGKALAGKTGIQSTPNGSAKILPSQRTDAPGGAIPENAAQDTLPSVEDDMVPLGESDPVSGRLVLSTARTLPTAQAYVRQFHQHPDGSTLCTYADIPMVWRDNCYREVEDATICKQLSPWLHNALQYQKRGNSGRMELVPFDSNPRTVTAALTTIKYHTHMPANLSPPCWIGKQDGRPPATEVLACRTMNLHVPSGRIIPATPAFFATSALTFDFDHDAAPPEQWIRFLEQLFGDDRESIELLQEFMGYTLVGDTSQQKMLLLVGPRRSGKGTIGRVWSALVGPGNVVGPTTSSLAGSFGLQPLIGKSMAIVSDARFHGENVPIVVERLLCISGEDSLAIDRKFLGSVNMKLPTRFVFLTNELPTFRDSSAALAGRFLILRLTKSFYGMEDPGLTARLLSELPGILQWALHGLRRLRTRGRFVMPKSGDEATRELEDLASPVGAFVRECCTVGVGKRVEQNELVSAWRAWCQRQGRDHPGTTAALGKDLKAAVPGIQRRRGTGLVPFYEGIALIPPELPT